MNYSCTFNHQGGKGSCPKLMYVRKSGDFEKPTHKKQFGSKVNYLKIFLVEYESKILSKLFGTKYKHKAYLNRTRKH